MAKQEIMTYEDFVNSIHEIQPEINVEIFQSKEALSKDLKDKYKDLKHNKYYMVYALTFKDKAIAIGHGRYDRAKVIFDNYNTYTRSHIKSTLIRFYHLAYIEDNEKNIYQRFVAFCGDKILAEKIEGRLHNEFGGNNNQIDEDIKKSVLKKSYQNRESKIIIDFALLSSYCGLSDLHHWRNNSQELGFDNEIWNMIWDDLNLKKDICKNT